MKRILAINGSPRKDRNTATLLKAVLEGAASCGASADLIHLYDLDYKGCRSCFACKRKGVRLDKCAIHDGLEPLLESITTADAVVLGSPFYFWDVTGQMRCVLERLLYPYFNYDKAPVGIGRPVASAFVFTMGIGEEIYQKELDRYGKKIDDLRAQLTQLFEQPSQSLVVCETYQFDDYSKYAASMFDPAAKLLRHETVFKEDCEKARALGAQLVR
jgi:multimeric flavodoxin WrbA